MPILPLFLRDVTQVSEVEDSHVYSVPEESFHPAPLSFLSEILGRQNRDNSSTQPAAVALQEHDYTESLFPATEERTLTESLLPVSAEQSLTESLFPATQERRLTESLFPALEDHSYTMSLFPEELSGDE
jgi:hypothetical protein